MVDALFKDYSKDISKSLMRIHKILMDQQLAKKEAELGYKLAPGSKLQLLLQDPEFEWLRVLSQLMAHVDDLHFQKDEVTEAQFLKIHHQLLALLSGEHHPEFDKNVATYRSILPLLDQELRQLQTIVQQIPFRPADTSQH